MSVPTATFTYSFLYQKSEFAMLTHFLKNKQKWSGNGVVLEIGD